MIRQGGYYRQAIALFLGALLFVLIVYTLEKTGVPRVYSTSLSGVFALAVYVLATFSAGTTRAGRFLIADRTISPGISSMAAVSVAGFPLLFLNGGDLYFLNPGFLVVIIVAIVGGFALKALLVSRQFNATHASDISEMLLARFNSPLPARLFAATNAIGGLILVACGIGAAAFLVSWFFALSFALAMGVVLACSFLSAALGGMGSVTRLAAVSTMLLLLGLNLPLLVHTLVEHGFPVGHLTAGVSGFQPAMELEQQLSSLNIPLIGDRINEASSILGWDSGLQVFAGLIILIACASLPSLVHLSATSKDEEKAGNSTQRSVLIAGFALASIFALLAFTKIGFYQSMLGLTLSEARVEAPFLYSWGGRETHLVELCGKTVENAAALPDTCPAGAEHIINIPDFQFEGALLLAASPDVATLPFAFTALLSISLVAALVSFTSAIVLATISNLVTAYYVSLPGKVASGRVFMVRMGLVIGLAVSAWLCLMIISDFGSAFIFAMSLSCSSAVPALFGSIYLNRCSSSAINTSIGAGFAICILFFVLATYGVDFTAATGDELIVHFPSMASPLPPEMGAVLALPFALALLFLIAGTMGSIVEGERDTAPENPTENA